MSSGMHRVKLAPFFMPKVLLFDFTFIYAHNQAYVLSTFSLLRVLSINREKVFTLERVTGVAFHPLRQLT